MLWGPLKTFSLYRLDWPEDYFYFGITRCSEGEKRRFISVDHRFASLGRPNYKILQSNLSEKDACLEESRLIIQHRSDPKLMNKKWVSSMRDTKTALISKLPEEYQELAGYLLE